MIKWIVTMVLCISVIIFACVYSAMFFARSEDDSKTNAIIIFTVSVFLDLVIFQILEVLVIAFLKHFSRNSKIIKKINNSMLKLRIWKSTKPDLDI